jgi:hypothetical protein
MAENADVAVSAFFASLVCRHIGASVDSHAYRGNDGDDYCVIRISGIPPRKDLIVLCRDLQVATGVASVNV